MSKGMKEKVKLIEVKPVHEKDTKHMMTYEESNANASPDDQRAKFCKINSLHTANNNLPACDKSINLQTETKEEKIIVNSVKSLIKYKQATEAVDSKHENDTNATQTSCEQLSSDSAPQINQKKAKRKKKRGKKKKEKEKKIDSDLKAESKCENTEEISVVEEDKASSKSEKSEKNESKSRKLPCLFGFISTWLAKRKERRRMKKRKAIEARSPTPHEQLVEYEHKKARGGVAFTVEIDSRPMRKPVLPPIRQRTSPIVYEPDEKLKRAEINRAEELSRKKKSSKEHSKKKADCNDRKYEIEYYFKQKVDLTIRHKQSDAQKNRKRILEGRRCPTPFLRAPSTLPPLRNIRVKPAAIADKHHDPDDDIFNF